MGVGHPAVEAVAGMSTRSSSPGAVRSTSTAEYTARLERLAEPARVRALFYPYLSITIIFIVWRVSIVNWHVWFGPVALAADLFGAVTMLTFLGITRSVYRPVHRTADLSARVVDCVITTHREPISLIEPTVIAALRVRGIRNVLLLGNHERADVRALATRLGALYYSRGSNEFAKAGSLNAGLKHTDAEFLLVLDADHIVLPQFLERTLGYFDDPAVAFVQTPQSFYNTDSFLFRRARGIAAGWWELKIFFHCTQLAKNRWNASFFCGSSAVLRRSAIDDVGGFATSTLTEDIHTSVLIHAKGWRSLYIPERLAFGLEAQNLKQYYSQRRRWAAGSVSLLFRTPDSPLIKRGLTISQRLNYINAATLHTVGIQRLFYLFLPLLTLVTLRGPVIIPISYYGIAFLAYFALSLTMAYIYGRGGHHLLHSESYCMANIPAQVSALTAIVRREQPFSSPPKNMVNAERTIAKKAIWALGLVCLSAIGYGAFLLDAGNHSALVIMAVVWSGINCIWLGSMITYLEWFERHPSPTPDNELTALEKYQNIVMQFGEEFLVRDDQPLPPPGEVVTTSSRRERTYSIHVTLDEDTAIDALTRAVGCRHVSIITDHVVNELHATRIKAALASRGVPVRSMAIPAGEQSKALQTAYQLFDWLARSDAGRRDVLVAIGGGVVIDTVGWVASAYMRGVPYINVPTTLLAQVDAAIGGKVAVDHQIAKNLIGSFYEPEAVVSCVGYLATLDTRQVRAGLAEVIKEAIIASPQLFSFIERDLESLLALDPASLRSLVHAASAIKCVLVGRDPYENDLRRTLNFGHTVGHAVETATGHGPVLHGEAVAYGMAVAVRIARARGVLGEPTASRITRLLAAAGLPVSPEQLALEPSEDDVIEATRKIRQVRAGSLRFVLPTGLGSALIADDVTEGEICAALHDHAMRGVRA